MYGSASGANPLLMQAFRGSGSSSSRSSPFPTPNPLAFSHTRSFSTSSHHTAAHSTLSSPGLSYASLNDDDMLSLSSPIGFPDLYPVPAINSSESSEILLTRVDGLGRDLNFMQGEIRGLRSTLEIVLEATRNPTNDAPWIRLASDVFRGELLILAKLPQLKQQYQLIPPSDERVPLPNTEPDMLLADMEQSTVPPPNTEPNTLLVNVEQSTDVVPDAGGADGAPPMQPRFLFYRFRSISCPSSDDIMVEPPPAPPAFTPGSAPAPLPPLPVTMSRVSKGKLCAPHSKHFTARNLHLAVYCVDVPCSEAEYKIEWSCLQSKDAARVKVYEKYANTLKNSKPKPTEIPMATVIRKRIEELLAEQNI
ncbi:hypothetical protein B0H10DRAFT_2208123 [Mycena sp. CBHHK59/15]|nr:hypothetical protein B0H10DRAFT_2208123 [Mycena sp. CBHHK59/15]